MVHLNQPVMNRRTFVTGTGLVCSVGLAGCMDEISGTDGTRPDPAAISVDGRLHNETEEPRSFEVRAETDDGYDIVDDNYEVPGGGTERIAGIGVPGATRRSLFPLTERSIPKRSHSISNQQTTSWMATWIFDIRQPVRLNCR